MEYIVYSSVGYLNAVNYFRSRVLLEDFYIWCGDLYMLITDAGESKKKETSPFPRQIQPIKMVW